MLGVEKLERYGKTLAKGASPARRRDLRELEGLACRNAVSTKEKKLIGLVLLANFHIRPLFERRTIARFLDVWFVTETSVRVAKRLEATRLEEVDPGTRNSLKVAAYSTMPDRELARALEEPSREDLTEGLGLLVALETAYTRLRLGTFSHRRLAELIRALRKARAHRASHIAKPFLWRLESVLELALKVGSYLPPSLR